jgi:cell division protein FtsL
MAVVEGARKKNKIRFYSVFYSDLKTWIVFITILFILLFVSFLSISNVNNTRKEIIDLNREYKNHDSLEREMINMHIEQQKLSEHSTVEDKAVKEKNMLYPNSKDGNQILLNLQ